MANYDLTKAQTDLILQKLRGHERDLRSDIKYMSEYEQETGELVEWQSPTLQEDKDELQQVITIISILQRS